MSDDVEPRPKDVLHVETRQDGTAPTIVVVGEFDMTGTERFWGGGCRVPGQRTVAAASPHS
jgi:hypothetical protein